MIEAIRFWRKGFAVKALLYSFSTSGEPGLAVATLIFWAGLQT
jgi:hypothetical protein